MSYIFIGAAIAVGALIWLLFKSRELTAAKLKLGKQRAAARAQFLRGADAALESKQQDIPNKRPNFGQR